MIAHQGGHGDAVDDARDRVEPRLPLAVVLAVVDEISHIDEEVCSFIALCRPLREVLPVRVVIRLRVRKNQRRERAAIIRLQRVPVIILAVRLDAVFIRLARLQSTEPCRVELDRHAVVRERLACSRARLDGLRAFQAVLDDRICPFHIRLPHDRARMGIVRRDDLAQIAQDRPSLRCAERVLGQPSRQLRARERPAAACQHHSTRADGQEPAPRHRPALRLILLAAMILSIVIVIHDNSLPDSKRASELTVFILASLCKIHLKILPASIIQKNCRFAKCLSRSSSHRAEA